eukprot:13861141-Ditylum_brightwellii.AAC.1
MEVNDSEEYAVLWRKRGWDDSLAHGRYLREFVGDNLKQGCEQHVVTILSKAEVNLTISNTRTEEHMVTILSKPVVNSTINNIRLTHGDNLKQGSN